MIFGRSVYAVLCLRIPTTSVAINFSKPAMDSTLICVLHGLNRKEEGRERRQVKEGQKSRKEVGWGGKLKKEEG